MSNPSRNVLITIVLIAAVNILFGIGSIPLLDPDEPVYAETAREMIEYGDCLSPRIYNEFWYDKPPLYYWLVAASFQIFGVSEFAARLPAGMMGIGTVLMVYFSGLRLFNERVGFWAAVILSTCVNMFYMGKACVTDTTLLFFMTGTLVAFLHAKYWFMYVCMGLAVLTKGPIGFCMPAAIIFLYLLLTGACRRLLKMHIPVGLALMLLICLPWYWLMYQIHGQEFLDTFIGLHNLGRFASAEHPEANRWFYYVPVLLLGIFPWTGLLLQSIKNTVSRSSGSDLSRLIFFQVWWAFVFLFFSVAQTKLVSYILPLYPAVAMMIGWNIDRMQRENRGSYWSWALGSGIVFLLLGVVWCVGGRFMPGLEFGGYILGGITFIVGVGIVVSLMIYRDARLAGVFHIAAGVLTMGIVFGFLLPVVAGQFNAKDVALHYRMLPERKAEYALYVDKMVRPGFMFYGREAGSELTLKQSCADILEKDMRGKYFVMRQSFKDKWANYFDMTGLRELHLADGIGIYVCDVPLQKLPGARPLPESKW